MVPFRPFLSNLSCKKLKPFAPIVRLVIFHNYASLVNFLIPYGPHNNFLCNRLLFFAGGSMLQRERKHSLIYFNDWKNQPKYRKVRVLIQQRVWFVCIGWGNWVLKIWKKIFCGFLTTFWFIINFSEKIIFFLKKS